MRLLPILAVVALACACADPPTEGRCTTERDCRRGQACVDGRCGGVPACAFDVDCAAGRICVGLRCVARSCRDDGDCPDRRCVGGWCRPPTSEVCADDGDCPAGRCVEGACTVDPCPPTGCAAACAADDDCPDDAFCADDTLCRVGCRAGGCPAATGAALCDLDSRRCVRVECGADADCPPEAYCGDGACRPGCRLEPDTCPGRCDRATRRCGCGVDGDCPDPTFCADDGVCRPGCRVGGCGGAPCDPVTRSCGATPCARDADCGADRVCGLDDRCAPAGGPVAVEGRCAQGGQCASGRCVDGRCQGRCAADADCPSGRCALVEAHLMCAPPPDPCAADVDCAAPRVCRPWWDGPPRLGCRDPVGPGAGGAACAVDGDCGSGRCVDGGCWAACADDAHCPGACVPGRLTVPLDPATGEGVAHFAGCLDPAAGSGARCAGDGACAAGEACGLWPDGLGFEGRCRVAAGPGRGGDGCAADADCRGRWCVAGRCVAPCGDDGVGGCADGVPCVEAIVETPQGAAVEARVCGAAEE